MALKLKCPCGERLIAPESAAGKRGKCSKCGRKFIIPAPKRQPSTESQPVGSAADSTSFGLPDLGSEGSGLGDDFGDLLDDALNEPPPSSSTNSGEVNPYASPTAAPRKRTGSTTAQMTTLANGIKLVFWGTVLVVLATLLGFFGGLLMPLLVIVGAGLTLLGNIMATIGRVVCLWGPKKTGGRGMLIAAVVCELISIVVSLFTVAGASLSFGEGIAALFGLATLILFVLFIQAVANSVGETQLAETARSIVILVVIAIVLLLASPIAMAVFPLFGLATVLGFLGVSLVSVFRYLNLLQYTAEAVRP